MSPSVGHLYFSVLQRGIISETPGGDFYIQAESLEGAEEKIKVQRHAAQTGMPEDRKRSA